MQRGKLAREAASMRTPARSMRTSTSTSGSSIRRGLLRPAHDRFDLRLENGAQTVRHVRFLRGMARELRGRRLLHGHVGRARCRSPDRAAPCPKRGAFRAPARRRRGRRARGPARRTRASCRSRRRGARARRRPSERIDVFTSWPHLRSDSSASKGSSTCVSAARSTFEPFAEAIGTNVACRHPRARPRVPPDPERRAPAEPATTPITKRPAEWSRAASACSATPSLMTS